VGLHVGRDDRLVRIFPPHALEQNDAVGLELAVPHPPEQHLLVEGDHQIGLVAAVGDALRSEPNAVAARARDAARRRADLGRNDLDRPHAVAHARRDGAERLAAALRAFARVADDLDHVLRQGDGGLAGGGRRPLECRCRKVLVHDRAAVSGFRSIGMTGEWVS
jgi:hypothetical protein